MATRRFLIFFLGIFLFHSSCTQSDGSRFNPLKEIAGGNISVHEEREIGYSVDRELQASLRMIEDPFVTEFLHNLGQSIVVTTEPQPFVYRFRVIDNPQLNAFAIPGGFIYFHSGTLLSAGSIDELAGVMSHEIGHIKGRHHAREQEKMAIPNLLAGVGAIAATVATGEAAPMVAAQAANIALQLSFRREFETEADRLAINFMARSGYDPEGITRFFERIALEEERGDIQIPPYLYSHPDVKDRIGSTLAASRNTRKTKTYPPELEAQFRHAQFRLALLAQSRSSAELFSHRPFDRQRNDPLLREARTLHKAEKNEEALEKLLQAQKQESNDPRPYFESGEIFFAMERYPEAALYYRHTLELDPDRALVLYKLGLSYRKSGNIPKAVYFLERARDQFGPGSALQKKADWEIEKLSFPILVQSAITDGQQSKTSETHGGNRKHLFHLKDKEVIWWGQVGPHFYHYLDEMEVQWVNPQGEIAQESEPQRLDGPHLSSSLKLKENPHSGEWTVHFLFQKEVLESYSFTLEI